MKKFRKIISMLTAVTCAASLCFGVASAEEHAEDTLRYGDYISYQMMDENDDGTADFVKITDCDKAAAEIEIPAEIDGLPVKIIGEKSFEKLELLETVIIPDTVEKIETYAFYNCKLLNNVEVPDKYIYIGNNAFEQTKLEMTASTIYIGKMLYKCGTLPLSKYTIMKDVVGICENAFYNCDIEEVILPENLVGIGANAFKYCSLKKIHIPESVKIIGTDAFYGNDIEEITVDENNEYFCVKDNILYNAELTKMELIAENIVSCEIPDTVTEIPENAFFGNDSLTEIKLPLSLKSIGESAFYNCKNLKNITLPEGLEEIGDRAFEFAGLTEITIPSTTEKIGFDAFYSGNLKKLVFADGIERLDTNEIWFSICFDPGGERRCIDYKGGSFNGIESVYIPKTLKYIGTNFFENATELTDVYFDGTKDEYNIEVAPKHIISISDMNYYSVSNGNTYYENAAFHYAGEEDVTTAVTATATTTTTTVSKEADVPQVSPIITPIVTTTPCGNGDGIVTLAATKATATTTTVSASITPITSVSVTTPMYEAQTIGHFTIDNLPDKLSYNIGEELDLSGLEMSIIFYPGGLTSNPNYHYTAVESVNPLDYPDLFVVDISAFDNTKSGEYTITISPTNDCKLRYWILKSKTFTVTVTEPEVTTTALTTSSATETTVTTGTTITTQPSVTGDADNDNELTVRDCSYIAKMIAEGKVKELPMQADFNGDGVVNVRDAAAIARKLAENKK